MRQEMSGTSRGNKRPERVFLWRLQRECGPTNMASSHLRYYYSTYKAAQFCDTGRKCRSWKNTARWFAFLSLMFSCLLYTAQDRLSQGGTVYRKLDLYLAIKKMSLQSYTRVNLMGAIPQLRVSLSGCINLTMKISCHRHLLPSLKSWVQFPGPTW